MDAPALHLELRNALTMADELARHAHVLGNDTVAGYLSGIRTSLGDLERNIGASHRHPAPPNLNDVETLERTLRVLRDEFEAIPIVLRPRLVQLMASLERIVFAELRPEADVPAKRVLGVLPVLRAIPQEAHSVIDYLAAAAYFASAAVAKSPRARIIGVLLGTKVAGTSLLTDYRLAATRRLPIELHEAMDYAVGVGAALTPFTLSYWKKDRLACAIQIAAGLLTVATSLFTDYRAHRGVSLAMRAHRDVREPASGRVRTAQTVLRPGAALRPKSAVQG